uniref:Uncharacterized protein n=1 Tax=Vespula pensylvanica TaxID=30213 RepID=A0A834JPI4_VESPE|nr:hypothetical protein H0235_017108 [Vespula pensylvanica]
MSRLTSLDAGRARQMEFPSCRKQVSLRGTSEPIERQKLWTFMAGEKGLGRSTVLGRAKTAYSDDQLAVKGQRDKTVPRVRAYAPFIKFLITEIIVIEIQLEEGDVWPFERDWKGSIIPFNVCVLVFNDDDDDDQRPSRPLCFRKPSSPDRNQTQDESMDSSRAISRHC